MPQLEIQRIGGEQLAALKPEWDTLLSGLGEQGSLFMSHSWYDCWWRHFRGDGEFFLLALRRGGRLVGIAPLMSRRITLHGLPVRAVGFIANGNSLHNDLVLLEECREEGIGELLDYLYLHLERWDLLQFHHVPADSPNCAALAERLARGGACYQVSPSYDSPYLDVAGGWEEFLAGRSQRVRKTLRNIANSIRRSGEVEVRQVTGLDEFIEVRDGLLEVARKSWTERVGDSLAHPVNAAFFEDLARQVAPAGGLSLWLLTLDGRPVAFEFHLRGCGKQHALRASFHEDFQHLSPGAFLEAEILKRLFSEPSGVTHFDFGGSFNEYKKRWSDRSLDHVTISAFNERFYSRVVAFYETELVRVLRTVRDRLRRRHGTS